MPLSNLPTDIILLIVLHLEPEAFLRFTTTSKKFHEYRRTPGYWKTVTRRTFRLPPQPLLDANGAQWEWLYKHLATQTHVYAWGSNSSGNLGLEGRGGNPPYPHGPFRSTGFPTEIDLSHSESVGVIADVQCGGWSTALMNARGQIFVAGVLDGRSGDAPLVSFTPLPVYRASSILSMSPDKLDRYDPSTAIEQFSLGRASMLGLSDSGVVWQWWSFYRPPEQKIARGAVFDYEKGFGRPNSKVTKVVAGWTHNSTYVESDGLLRYWDASQAARQLWYYDEIVPPPAGKAPKSQTFPTLQTYIVLEDHIVFLTADNNELYAWPLSADVPAPVELTSFYEHTRDEKIRDLQGSFRNFGVITEHNTVLLGTSDLLHQYCHLSATATATTPSDLPQPTIRRALQHSGVTGLAFGDWHMHALHADGTITSYGHEPQGSGSLGLANASPANLRGVLFRNGRAGDGVLRVPSWGDGRRTVWFETEKFVWLSQTCQKGAIREAQQRATHLSPESVELLGEWFERGGRDWAAGPDGPDGGPEDADTDGVGAYFVLKVAAAGWSSAALVLRDDEKAERIRRKYVLKSSEAEETADPGPSGEQVADSGSGIGRLIGNVARSFGVQTGEASKEASKAAIKRKKDKDMLIYDDVYVWDDQPFPRLRFPDGTLMPGTVPETPWKGGPPDFGKD